MQKYLPKSLIEGTLLKSLLVGRDVKLGWKNKPADWSDIRKDCPANSIALYAAHTEDYSSYDNLGFTANCTGGYDVYIDGVQFGTTYASGAQCSITWSTSGITTGDSITDPSALKAHVIWITPATDGAEITAFHCDRIAVSGEEQQGILWAHFNIKNQINIKYGFGKLNSYTQPLMQALTAKNNVIKVTGDCTGVFAKATSINYLPVIDGNGNTVSGYAMFFGTSSIKAISFKNINFNNLGYFIYNCTELENIKGSFNSVGCKSFAETFSGSSKLKKGIPALDYSSAEDMTSYMFNCTAIENFVLDLSSANKLKKVGCYASNAARFMAGFKGLRVSNEAPFDNATAPQINVSYTGMDRSALVQLFEDLPTVSDGQIINITGCTGASSLTDDDKIIATAKGWTITL